MSKFQIHRFSDEEKLNYVTSMTDPMLQNASDYERALYEQFVEEGCARDEIHCLEAKGYGCYGGNAVFACDYEVSRDCLKRLLELTDNASYANSLAFLYLYGRVGEGPDYQTAVQYFMLGAAQGIFESTYQLADLFESGKGVIQSPGACANLISMLYARTKDILCHREYRGKFAEVAMRMGHLMEKGIGFEANLVSAYAAYLQANLAVELRIHAMAEAGDLRLAVQIKHALRRTYEALKDEDFFLDKIEMSGPLPLGEFLETYGQIRVRLTEEENGGLRVDFHGIKKADSRRTESEDDFDNIIPKQLVTIAEFSTCILSSRLSIHMLETEVIYRAQEEGPFVVDELVIDPVEGNHYLFLRAGEILLDLEAKKLMIYKEDLI